MKIILNVTEIQKKENVSLKRSENTNPNKEIEKQTNRDRVSISETALNLLKNETLNKEKINNIKNLVDNKEYFIDPQKVSNNIIKFEILFNNSIKQ
jgi:anti-sigma28 factor (negative regulator of flagellin synthesis)